MSHRNQIISLRIMAFVALGFDVADATDAVLGAGTFTRAAGELYDQLRMQAKS